MTLYRFDKKLRILLFNEIEKIEIAIRSVLANIGCQELNDKYWITEAAYFANSDYEASAKYFHPIDFL